MIYFDNSATTKIDPQVLDTYNKVATNIWGNPSSLHKMGDRAHQLLEASRKQIAGLLGVKQHEIFFTSGGTESNNTAIKGTAIQSGNLVSISLLLVLNMLQLPIASLLWKTWVGVLHVCQLIKKVELTLMI